MIDSRLSNRWLQHLPELLQGAFREFLPEQGHLLQRFRKRFPDAALTDHLNLLQLLPGGSDCLHDIRRLAVHLPVDSPAHLLHNPRVLHVHHTDMRPQKIQHIHDDSGIPCHQHVSLAVAGPFQQNTGSFQEAKRLLCLRFTQNLKGKIIVPQRIPDGSCTQKLPGQKTAQTLLIRLHSFRRLHQ